MVLVGDLAQGGDGCIQSIGCCVHLFLRGTRIVIDFLCALQSCRERILAFLDVFAQVDGLSLCDDGCKRRFICLMADVVDRFLQVLNRFSDFRFHGVAVVIDLLRFFHDRLQLFDAGRIKALGSFDDLGCNVELDFQFGLIAGLEVEVVDCIEQFAPSVVDLLLGDCNGLGNRLCLSKRFFEFLLDTRYSARNFLVQGLCIVDQRVQNALAHDREGEVQGFRVRPLDRVIGELGRVRDLLRLAVQEHFAELASIHRRFKGEVQFRSLFEIAGVLAEQVGDGLLFAVERELCVCAIVDREAGALFFLGSLCKGNHFAVYRKVLKGCRKRTGLPIAIDGIQADLEVAAQARHLDRVCNRRPSLVVIAVEGGERGAFLHNLEIDGGILIGIRGGMLREAAVVHDKVREDIAAKAAVIPLVCAIDIVRILVNNDARGLVVAIGNEVELRGDGKVALGRGQHDVLCIVGAGVEFAGLRGDRDGMLVIDRPIFRIVADNAPIVRQDQIRRFDRDFAGGGHFVVEAGHGGDGHGASLICGNLAVLVDGCDVRITGHPGNRILGPFRCDSGRQRSRLVLLHGQFGLVERDAGGFDVSIGKRDGFAVDGEVLKGSRQGTALAVAIDRIQADFEVAGQSGDVQRIGNLHPLGIVIAVICGKGGALFDDLQINSRILIRVRLGVLRSTAVIQSKVGEDIAVEVGVIALVSTIEIFVILIDDDTCRLVVRARYKRELCCGGEVALHRRQEDVFGIGGIAVILARLSGDGDGVFSVEFPVLRIAADDGPIAGQGEFRTAHGDVAGRGDVAVDAGGSRDGGDARLQSSDFAV